MPESSKQKNTSRDKARTHRERLRTQALRPVQLWVHDRRTPVFAAEAHRQSLAAANSPTEAEDQAFVDAISEVWDSDE